MAKSNRFFLYITIISLSIPLFFSSCASKKEYVYFYNKGITASDSSLSYTPILKPDDILGITVSSISMDAAIPFNLPSVSFSTNGQAVGNPTMQGYLIDSKGMIDFPVIGKIKLAGLSRSEATDLLKEKISNYISNPIVIIRILNFKVTILGDVRNPGSYTIPNERITLLEGLGLAGDLNITGKRNNILVVRDNNGKQTGTNVDITSSDFINSPYYYLNQNDVIYVEQNKTKINSARSSANTSIVLSSISLLITTINILLSVYKN